MNKHTLVTSNPTLVSVTLQEESTHNSMWSRSSKVLSALLQRARAGGGSSSSSSSSGLLHARLALGAALSLVVLAELDDDQRLRGRETSLLIWSSCCCEAAAKLPSVDEQLKQHRQRMLRTRQTVRKMEEDSSSERLENRYSIDWNTPLGEGSFGVVYLGVDRKSGERVAVKKISKKLTGAHELQLEMRALLHLRDSGGHPNICSLRENFSEDGYYYLILDLVEGGEMFFHLVEQGAYSEADAARLVREVASALAFLHGGPGLIHNDLKPENLMLSSRNPSDAVIKLIDFGCAAVMIDDEDDDEVLATPTNLNGRTLAYCPPEVLDQSRKTLDPSVDMWALVCCCCGCRFCFAGYCFYRVFHQTVLLTLARSGSTCCSRMQC